MHVAALKQFAQHMAHLLADAEQPDRAAFGGFSAAHLPHPDRHDEQQSNARQAKTKPGATKRANAPLLQTVIYFVPPDAFFVGLRNVRSGHSVRARSSTSKTSSMSPALMSLVSASITPHSR